MGLFRRLGKVFAGDRQRDSHALWIYVRCQRCGEAIATRVDLRNEPSIQYSQDGQPAGYRVRKVLVGGKQRCYQPIEVELSLDASHRLVDREIIGGDFITAAEFEAQSPAE